MIKDLFFTKRTNLLYLFIAFLLFSVQAQDVLKVLYEQTGTASFYNKKFNGRKTSSGEKLNNGIYTAAHPSIPFGTMVRVTNQKNGKWVVVKINDRFSPRKGHILDLTYSAAQEIDMIRQGIAHIKLEVLDITESEAEAEFTLPPDTITYKLNEKLQTFPVERSTNDQPMNLKHKRTNKR